MDIDMTFNWKRTIRLVEQKLTHHVIRKAWELKNTIPDGALKNKHNQLKNLRNYILDNKSYVYPISYEKAVNLFFDGEGEKGKKGVSIKEGTREFWNMNLINGRSLGLELRTLLLDYKNVWESIGSFENKLFFADEKLEIFAWIYAEKLLEILDMAFFYTDINEHRWEVLNI